MQYKEASGAKLFLHVFNPEGHKTTDARPAIVFFFGGGWNGGMPKQFEPLQYLPDAAWWQLRPSTREKPQ